MKAQAAVRAIQEIAAARCGTTANALRSDCRGAKLVLPRHVAMALCRDLLEIGLVEIGQAFGGRDHTSVLHALRKVASAEVEGGNEIARLLAQLRTYCAADPAVREARVVLGLEQPEGVDHAHAA